MQAVQPLRLGLIVRSSSYQQRLARAEVDFSLAAAAMDLQVQVYFMGFSMLQLVSKRATVGALLPAGYRAWAALPDLGDAQVFVEDQWLGFCQAAELELVMPVEALSVAVMKQAWRRCAHVVVL